MTKYGGFHVLIDAARSPPRPRSAKRQILERLIADARTPHLQALLGVLIRRAREPVPSDRPVTAQEVADELGLDRRTVAKRIRTLDAAGVIWRASHPTKRLARWILAPDFERVLLGDRARRRRDRSADTN